MNAAADALVHTAQPHLRRLHQEEQGVGHTFAARFIIGQAGFQLFDLFDLCYYGNVFWQVDAVFVKRSLVAQTPALRPMSVPPFDIQRWRPMRPHVPLAQRIRLGVARRLLKR